ncbi:hypothetical protein ACHHYP_15294, partial [Achlya hypogyna]
MGLAFEDTTDKLDLEAVVTGAQAVLQSLQAAIRDADDTAVEAAVVHLTSFTTKLGLDYWTMDALKLQHRSTLHDRLTLLSDALSTAVPAPAQTPLSDSELVAHTSSGAALHGVCYCLPSTAQARLAPKAILAEPAHCRLVAATAEVTEASHVFQSVAAANAFRATVKACGLSFGLDANNEHNSDLEEHSASVTSLPLKEFDLDPASLRLLDSAVVDGMAVTTEADAWRFLEEYGSHVPSGVHRFGGILWKTSELSAVAPVSELTAACDLLVSQHLSIELEGFVDCWGGTVRQTSYADWLCEIVSRIEAVGPEAPSYAVFRHKLLQENHMWKLIDRQTTALVPVWDLLGTTPGCALAASLMRHVWLNYNVPWLGASIQQTQLQTVLEATGATPSVEVCDIPAAIEHLLQSHKAAALPDTAQLTTPSQSCSRRTLETASTSSFGHCTSTGFTTDLTPEHVEHMVTEMRSVLRGHAGDYGDSSGDDMPVPPLCVTNEPANMCAGRPLSHLLVVTPRPDKAADLPGLIWHVLKHCLSFTKELCGGIESVATASASSKAVRGRKARAIASAKPEVLRALLTLLSSLTLTARAEVHRLLLDRRCLVPYMVPTASMFRSEATALSLIDTFIGDRSASLMRDTSCTRIAVVSERPVKSSVTKDWIRGVFHVDSVHCFDRTYGSPMLTDTVAELGWGFLERNTEVTPVLPLLPYIHQFANVLIIDAGAAEEVGATLSRGCVIQWHNSDEDFDDEITDDRGDVFTVAMRCTMSSSHERITDYLLDEVPPVEAQVPVHLLHVPGVIAPSSAVSPWTSDAVAATDFALLRTVDLKLQLLFAQQAEITIALEREVHTADRQVLKQKLRGLEAQHMSLAPAIKKHPLLRHFIQTLQLPSVAEREAALVDLERQLADGCKDASECARAEYRVARDAYSATESEAHREAYEQALVTWSLTVTGMEHLWRELSHIFAVNPDKHKALPQLAARHLLDGFSLELMDGDAAMVNMKWVRAVFNRLGDALPPGARIFVLSIMGVQSSGKSTLLNFMFGTRLRTSVARCTRGVNLQLLKVDGYAAYDFILLLDTEGIRSPEYVGMEGSAWRDNRMATLAILPSDATIILTKGESTVTISEILPIVLSVYLGSELAEQYGGYLAASIRAIWTIVDTLMKNLKDNATKVDEIRRQSIGGAASVDHFGRLRATLGGDADSDVRFLGMTRGPSAPPLD